MWRSSTPQSSARVAFSSYAVAVSSVAAAFSAALLLTRLRLRPTSGMGDCVALGV
jgi:hypothetical protein